MVYNEIKTTNSRTYQGLSRTKILFFHYQKCRPKIVQLYYNSQSQNFKTTHIMYDCIKYNNMA